MYHPEHTTSVLWEKKINILNFTLVIDKFGIKNKNKWHIKPTTKSWKWIHNPYRQVRENCIRVYLKWEYTNIHTDLSMPGYVKAIFTKFYHSQPNIQ